MQQNQDIKGFTILELLVVITIVAVVSAVGYPNFMDWREDREMRASMEKVSSMLRSINTQVQRGNFAVVQFMVRPKTNSTEFFSKDTRYFLKEGKLSNLINVSIDGKLTNNYIIICTRKNALKTGGKCGTTQNDGLEKPAYLVEWNRFGKISKFKWGGSAWSRL